MNRSWSAILRTRPCIVFSACSPVIVAIQECLSLLELFKNFSHTREPDAKEWGSMGWINRLPGGWVLSAGARACTSASGDLSCCTYNQLKKLASSPPALPLLSSTHMLTDRGAETPLPQQLALNDISVGETSGTTPASSTSAVVCVERRGWKHSLGTLWTGYVQSDERHSFC